MNAVRFHIVFWITAYFVWLWLTQNFHPSWSLRILSTLVLIVASAGFAIFGVPRTPRTAMPGTVISLLGLYGATAAIVIYIFYELLEGPNPLRLYLWQNILIDISVVLFNTIVAAGVATILTAITGQNCWRIEWTTKTPSEVGSNPSDHAKRSQDGGRPNENETDSTD